MHPHWYDDISKIDLQSSNFKGTPNYIFSDFKMPDGLNFFPAFCLVDTPMAVVTFGRSLNPKSILEGADVYFECHVKSNPPFYNITWRNNVSF